MSKNGYFLTSSQRKEMNYNYLKVLYTILLQGDCTPKA